MDSTVAADGRSGTVVLSFDKVSYRSFGFGGAGDAPQPGRIGNHAPRVVVATRPEGEAFSVDWQRGEIAQLVDFGRLADAPAGLLFDRLSVHEARQRMQTRPVLFASVPVRPDHVYVLSFDGASFAERYALPGDPLFIKLQVTAQEPGRRMTVRWAIVNEPFDARSPDGSWDCRRLPRLEQLDGITATERAEVERLLPDLIKGEAAALAALQKDGHRMLPGAVNLLCSFDPRNPADAAKAWSLDAALTLMVRGGDPAKVKQAAADPRTLGEYTAMIRYWYAFARRTRSAEQWQSATHQNPQDTRLPYKEHF